jgi:hypothetical protein
MRWALLVGLVVGAVVVVASRLQLAEGGPGVMAVTVPVPALLLLVVSLLAARACGFRTGLLTGALALVVSFVVVAAVVAIEGQVWMAQLGVFMLDADPPSNGASTLDVALDFFTTGLWIGHLAFWLPWPAIGAALGARLRGASVRTVPPEVGYVRS